MYRPKDAPDRMCRADLGDYYLVEEVDTEIGKLNYGIETKDAEIAALNKMLSMKQDDWIEVCEENDALTQRVKELEAQNAKYWEALDYIRNKHVESHEDAEDMKAEAREALKED